MYKVVAPFIYRTRLYVPGQKLTEFEYMRITRDKTAIKRQIIDKIALDKPQEAEVILQEEPETKVEEPETKVEEPETKVEEIETKVEEPVLKEPKKQGKAKKQN